MLIEVAVLAVPSLVAQQGGKKESVVVPLAAISAQDTTAAVLLTGAANAEAITKANADEDNGALRVIVRQVG